MDLTLLNLLPLLVVIGLVFVAVRAHERYWTLGFLGWRKVYAGLGLYIVAGVLYAVEFWLLKSPSSPAILSFLRAGVLISGVAGLALVLAGSIERLRELSAERTRLEDLRAGFDLFDSLREIIAQPYSFLEVLDYSLKEMVRAAGVDSGGLWLYNPKKPEWVLTGWANMPEKLRQQTESVTGSGTGFDRLAAAHKARLFSSPDKIRLFFPEWEAEGYQSILGMPLASGAVGSAGRQILGAIVLTDRSPQRFDDDRARRLYAASDYVAAVIAEARITRQLEAARQQLDGSLATLEQERREASRQKLEAIQQLEKLGAERDEERKSLELAHAATIAELMSESNTQLQQLRSETEQHLADEKTRAEEQLQSTRTELEKRLANEKAFAVEKLHDTKAEFEKRLADEKAHAAEALHSARTELEKRLSAETTRVEQLQSRLHDISRTAEQLEKRLESERAGWEKRLDQLHRELKSETERARQRETELTASHQAYVTETDGLFGDLEQELEAEKQKSSERTASLQAARASLSERESALTAERKSREEAAASHRAALGALEARLKTLEAQLQTEQQRGTAHYQEAQAARATIDELETTLETAQDEHGKTIESLTAQLSAAREATSDLEQMAENLTAQVAVAEQAANEARHAAAREIQSLRLMIDDRDVQLAARHEAARDAIEEAGRHQEMAAEERKSAAVTIARLESELRDERSRRESTEHDIEVLRAEWTEFETRREREIVEERLKHRRQMHALEGLNQSLTHRSQRLLTIPEGPERVAAALRCVGDRLPPGTQLYFWQRLPGGEPRMVAWLDARAHVFQGESLSPWPFEVNTIPAEGVRRLTGPGQWESLSYELHESARAEWTRHWGNDRAPHWAICWPWGASAQESNGWVTAFGFGSVLVTDEQADEAATWVGFVAAALVGSAVSDIGGLPGAVAAPLETREETLNAEGVEEVSDGLEELIPAADVTEELTEAPPEQHDSMPVADEATDESTAPDEEREVVQSDLHNTVIQWAADQIEDAFNLDLSARPGVPVDQIWLRRALERGRASCRQSEQGRAEFDVSTLNENGWTVLRLIRSSESAPGADLAAVEDSDLSGSPAETGGGSRPSEAAETDVPVSGRWLLCEGNTIGMELRFTSKHSDQHLPEAAVPVRELSSSTKVMIVNDREAMGDLLTGMIQALGGSAFTAGDFEQAQERIASAGVDIAVVDTTMAGDDGWQIARRLVESNPQIPVLLIIGSDTVTIPDDAAGHWLLRMPFQIEELRESLEGMIAPRSQEGAINHSE